MQIAPGAWRYALPPLAAAPFALLVSVPAGGVLAILGAAVLAFFRDPERSPPPSGVVAPADGKISVLRREDGGVRLGVFMNVWNVHVVRAPTGGTVAAVEHTAGAYKPAFSKDSDRNERVHVRFTTADENERVSDEANVEGVLTGENGEEPAGTETRSKAPDNEGRSGSDLGGAPGTLLDVDVGDEGLIEEVTLIAGAFARRISPYVEPEETVDRGERIGHIAFGSRVDVVFSRAVSIDDIAVEPGEKVTAGETVLLESESPISRYSDVTGREETMDG